MENATKALLIAAAILIAIIIISFGIFVVRQGQESIQGADLSEAEAAQFNAKFQMYGGENVSGAQVNALLNTIFMHNRQEKTAGTARYVSLDGDAGIQMDEDTETIPRVDTGSYYYVNFAYDNGIISEVTLN